MFSILPLFAVSLSKSLSKYGSRWKLVFYQNTNGGVFFSQINDGLFCDNARSYSILSNLDESYKFNGKYEFLLEYPAVTGYNRWRQSLNPINDIETNDKTAIGYEAVHIDWTAKFWGGLVRSSSSYSLLDGSAGTSHWWYAIGVITNGYSPNFPGPAIEGLSDGTPVQEVYLWVRTTDMTSNAAYKFKLLFMIAQSLLF